MGKTNSEVASAWRQGKEARCGHLRSDGRSLYSYSTEIARHYPEGGSWVSDQNYSVTTTRHQREACGGFEIWRAREFKPKEEIAGRALRYALLAGQFAGTREDVLHTDPDLGRLDEREKLLAAMPDVPFDTQEAIIFSGKITTRIGPVMLTDDQGVWAQAEKLGVGAGVSGAAEHGMVLLISEFTAWQGVAKPGEDNRIRWLIYLNAIAFLMRERALHASAPPPIRSVESLRKKLIKFLSRKKR